MAVCKNKHLTKAPTMFNIEILETVVMRTQGTKIALDNKGYATELSLANLTGPACDKMCPMVKKWEPMNKVHVDIKTTDGDALHLCFVGFTKKMTCKNLSILTPDSFGKDMENACQSIYLLYDVFFELRKLMFHDEGSNFGKVAGKETRAKVE
ncbi:hypothetical protein FD754_001267 [Muntiacus muntjak]|uniref:Uncharacterized protein n=1 Tax=Muntiacus muntjak TaxID=9888 RepID=A0A5N3W651_MUNMU|nr:hypothetical protein FD754_001267 [Muntiacus muntjak]